jgi:hypothetical protein
MESWPDQIAERVNCFDLQHWLPGLAHWLGLETAALLPVDARRKWLVTSQSEGARCSSGIRTLAFLRLRMCRVGSSYQ